MAPPATRTLWQGKLFRQFSASSFGCGANMLEQHRQVVALCHRVLSTDNRSLCRFVPARMDLRNVFATNLRRRRHTKRLSQDDLAYEAGGQPQLSQPARKGALHASLKIVGRLGEALDAEPAEFLKLPARTRVLFLDGPSPSAETTRALARRVVAYETQGQCDALNGYCHSINGQRLQWGGNIAGNPAKVSKTVNASSSLRVL
jgi:hypothetical protein